MLLEQRDLEGVLDWVRADRGGLRTLTALTFQEDELLRWRALEALGRVAGSKAGEDLESARDLIRRFIWLMTDESGGTGWFAPEAIGEILANTPALIPEYGRLLAVYFHEEPFERGAYYAVARNVALNPDAFMEIIDGLTEGLDAEDPYIRAWAGFALKHLGALGEEARSTLLQDGASLRIYDFDRGEIKETTVKGLVEGLGAAAQGSSGEES
jgi:HEAT repeat protein